ncbi:MAG: DNA sulfur modification protein DndD [Planctomycetota bacterium]|nr:DNA sulfur modification protein DndD [Planctomycetota bacterium]
MILDRLTLRNFCLYRGQQTFELAPTVRGGKPAPIVLFGGINGGGKTTFLDAVQLVLYGIRARCSKRADKPYEQFLRESIHRGVDPAEGAEIQLVFRYAAQGQELRYEVTRSWSLVRDRIRENVQVCRDGEPDGWMSENWNQLVEELIPLGIAQLCFFDAEKIRFLAEDDTSTQALGVAIKSLLGLDLAERLVADAAVLEGRVAKRARKSTDLQELERLEEAFEIKQAEIHRLVQELGALENPRLVAIQRLQQTEDQFARIGGQHWEQRETRHRRRAELEQLVADAQERLVGLAATELPLALLRPDLLPTVADQANRERGAEETAITTRLLAERDEQLLNALKQQRAGSKAIKLVQEFLEQDRARRAAQVGQVFQPDVCVSRVKRERLTDADVRLESLTYRLALSEGVRRALEHLLDRGLAERLATADELLKKLDTGQRELADVERGLQATPEEASVRDVAEQLKAASTELAAIDQQAKRLEKQLDGLRSEREQWQKDLQKLRRKVVDEEIDGEEDARIGKLLGQTQQTMQEFLRRATASKIDHLSGSITESFRFLLRKKSLVHLVLIDPATFAITLYDDQGHEVPKQRLSEGEKQIFAISVLWGLSRASARPLPAIIDTPMARLDGKHRDKLVERYFPHASHQVIVLSTDTEIERRYFHDLQPHIARAYHLNYDDEKKVTVADEGYFWEPSGEKQEHDGSKRGAS